MALDLTTVVSVAQYRARVAPAETGSDATLDAHLLAGTRLAERSLGLAPGMLQDQAAETFDFDSTGGQVLFLRDGAGRQLLLRSTTSIGIDTEQDGTFDGETHDLEDDAWIRGHPDTAAAMSEPYTALELLGHLSGAERSVWPVQRASVRIAGAWGWASTPEPLVDFVAHMVHDIREAHAGGATLDVPTIDGGGLRLQDDTWRLWNRIASEYGHRMVTF